MGTSPRRLAGYASIFDTPDRGRDIVRRGAFQRAEPHVPLLWQHDPHRPIGRVDMLREDGRGLRVIASLSEGSRIRMLPTALVIRAVPTLNRMRSSVPPFFMPLKRHPGQRHYRQCRPSGWQPVARGQAGAVRNTRSARMAAKAGQALPMPRLVP